MTDGVVVPVDAGAAFAFTSLEQRTNRKLSLEYISADADAERNAKPDGRDLPPKGAIR